jgi:integrase
MRISELLGLEWKNVDLAAGVLHIERQTGRFYGQSGVRLLLLKTRAAERNVVIPPSACRLLRWHQDVQRLERKRAEEEGLWEEHGVVFCGTTGGLHFRSQSAAEFRRITVRLGIEDATLHTFRHTVTTMVQEAGLPLKVALSLMGHATERTTSRVFSHPMASGLLGVSEVTQRRFGDVELVPPALSIAGEGQ